MIKKDLASSWQRINLVNQRVALLMLKKLGYKADVVANGLEVLQLLNISTTILYHGYPDARARWFGGCQKDTRAMA